VLDQMQAEARELAFLPDPGIGQPDRRHEVAVGERRQHLRVDLVGLARQRGEALDLLGVGDLDRPAFLLKRVVDEPGAGHRLDHGADGLAEHLLDPVSEPPQRVDVGRDGELVEMLTPIGKQADVELSATEIESSVQHVSGPPWCSFSVNTTSVSPGGPPSWQSEATAARESPMPSRTARQN
jgi:hypothetical protein